MRRDATRPSCPTWRSRGSAVASRGIPRYTLRVPRDPALRPYRIAMYCAFGLACAFLFAQILRSVVGDLYGRRLETATQQSPHAFPQDNGRLCVHLSGRAVQPAPGGVEGGAVARGWDAWSRRWEDEVDGVNQRCRLGS